MTADRLHRRSTENDTPQVRADQEGLPVERPIVFVLPGLGGEEDPQLEGFWGPTRSIFDLVPIVYLDWTDLIEAGCDFDIIAEHVRSQIENKMHAGPIRMAGYSIGGHLAYATALFLQNEGRQVESIAILDAPASVSDFTPPLPRRIQARVAGLLGLNIRSGVASVVAKILIMDRSRPLLRRLSRYRSVSLPFRFDSFLHHKLTMQLVRRVYPQWWNSVLSSAAPLKTRTYLFRSEEHQRSDREDLGWSTYCVDLKIIPVAGSHRGMLDHANNATFRAAFVEAMNDEAD